MHYPCSGDCESTVISEYPSEINSTPAGSTSGCCGVCFRAVYVRTRQLIVISTNKNFIPFCPAAAVVNIRQIGAVKCTVSNALHAVRDCYARQPAAPLKRTAANARHTVWNRYTRQTAAAGKRRGADVRYAVRDCYARQAAAAGKRSLTNARNAVRDCYARKATAVGKCIIADTRYTVRDFHARQITAVGKRRVANARHAGFNDNGSYLHLRCCPS